MSGFDADQFLSDLMRDAVAAAEEDIEESGVEIECPHCGKPVRVFPGSNTCPHCQNEIESSFDL